MMISVFCLRITAWKVSVFWRFYGPHSVRMWKNTNQKYSGFGHFSRSGLAFINAVILRFSMALGKKYFGSSTLSLS